MDRNPPTQPENPYPTKVEVAEPVDAPVPDYSDTGDESRDHERNDA